MEPFDAYVICTSPRSGSTLLCKMLQNTGVAGCPESHFHTPSLARWMVVYEIDPALFERQDAVRAAVFAAAVAYGKGGSGPFGLRLQRHSFDYFAQQLCALHPTLPNVRVRMDAVFGRTLFIHLTRETKLEQAISYVKATQSGLWHGAPDGTEIERLSAPKALTYDPQGISEQCKVFEAMDDAWDAWFTAESIDPLRITYEALSADPYAVLAQVLAALGIEYAPRGLAPLPVGKLADAQSQEWAGRFRAERQI